MKTQLSPYLLQPPLSLRGGCDFCMNLIKKRKTVFAAMSGGVDSSVAALLLKQQGYEVVGIFMKNWTKVIPGVTNCPWERDQEDVRRGCAKLDIPFYTWSF